jgi:hypothetical protein
VWSADVLQWTAGWWPQYEKITGLFMGKVWEARQVPRYQMEARWIIEKWHPPEDLGIGTPESWEEATRIVKDRNGLDFDLELGPYPSRGMYVHAWTCDGPNGEYLNITPLLAEIAVELAMMPVPSVSEMRAYAERRQEREEERKFKMVDDMVGDSFPFLGRVSNVSPMSNLKKILEQKKRGLQL